MSGSNLLHARPARWNWMLMTGLLVLALVGTAQAAETDARQALIDQARAAVLRDVAALEGYLAQGGQSFVSGWAQYLNIDALKAEVAQPQPSSEKLLEIWHRFYAPVEGLERDHFLKLRESIRRLTVVLETEDGDLAQAHQDALSRLQSHLVAYRASDSREDAQAIGPLLAWLEATGADKQVTSQVRKELGHPNAYIRVSSRLANYFLTRPVVEKERVNTTIGDTRTTGDAETRSTLWLESVPENRHGAIDIRLTGKTTTTNSVSHKGPVTIYGSAVTTIDARVRLTLHDDLLRIEPPIVRCVTKSQIHDISANRRIIERIAWRRAPEEKPAAEQAAARQVEKRLSERLGAETKKLMAQANNMYANKVRLPMTRRGAWPTLRYFTDKDSLHLRFYQASGQQVSAPNGPPKWPVEGDLTLAGHESMLENMFEGIFGGREIEDTRFLYMHELMTGEAPRALWVHDREPRWSVVMEMQRPLRLRLREGQMRMTMAIHQTQRGEQTYDTPALVTGIFTAEATSDGPVFYRQGPVTVEFPGAAESAAHHEELRTFLVRKFSAVMPEELHFDGLTAPAGGFGDKLNQLVAREVSFQSGWVTLRYQLDMTRAPKTQLITTTRLGD